MSLKECYDKMGADYEDVLSRLRSEVLVRKFALKFLDDDSYANLLHTRCHFLLTAHQNFLQIPVLKHGPGPG